MKTITLICWLAGLCSLWRPLTATDDALAAGRKPLPTLSDLAYGPDPRQVLDLWLPASDAAGAARPLALFLHGGAFLSGDKSLLPQALLAGCLERGMVVAAVNYRFATAVPLPGPMRDAGLALQTLRAQAEHWRIDPGRVVLLGGSAGAGMALWLAFHADLADPSSADPVLRQSTRPRCVVAWDAQTSYDPRFVADILGPVAARHPALPTLYGLDPAVLDSPRAHALYREASPIEHVTAGAPPVLLYYDEADGPLPADARPGDGMHHPAFGPPLRRRMEAVGGSCHLRHRDDYRAGGGSLLDDVGRFLSFYL